MSRAGIPDYVIAMRKPGDNPQPVAHESMDHWAGENGPTDGNMSHERWRRYASPVWMDIDQGNTLNAAAAREQDDERHIAPLQLDLIERCVWLWSNPGDTVLSPFMGVGSEGYVSLKMDRRFIGCELKPAYFRQAVKNLRIAETTAKSQLALM